VYSGGSNGVIWIYHLDGRVVQGGLLRVRVRSKAIC
jgi:hypothetical protein